MFAGTRRFPWAMDSIRVNKSGEREQILAIVVMGIESIEGKKGRMTIKWMCDKQEKASVSERKHGQQGGKVYRVYIKGQNDSKRQRVWQLAG